MSIFENLNTNSLLLGASCIALAALILLGIARKIVAVRISRGDSCPKCRKLQFLRVRRRLHQRLFCMGMRARRYRCQNPSCEWEGLLRSSGGDELISSKRDR